MNRDDAKMAREVLASLRERPVPTSDPEQLEARRERVLTSVRAMVRDVPLRNAARWRRTMVAMALPAAAAIALIVGATMLHWRLEPTPASDVDLPVGTLVRIWASEGQVIHETEEATQTLAAGDVADVPAGGRIKTGEGAEARVESRDLEVTLRESTEVSIPEEGLRSIRVAHGGVRCVVPSLGPDRQFSVVTPDATVVVHGTVFSVSFTEEIHQTCVNVEEGIVSVRRASGKIWLEAGESWGCEQGTTTPADAPPPARQPATRSAQPGTLAAENALFQAALASERQGDLASARDNLRRLLDQYPDSPLAPEARATLARLQKK